ncbi:C-C motif chemokine 36.1 [Danio aesculapii]|uniref:C-C motif chemokine 36.1 n=1 Tax=Danio aesculapii TaxID=1142201 RepID=UPI0024C0172E|nr:C-C motif chemokine 36.1 [Danio aesculapii]
MGHYCVYLLVGLLAITFLQTGVMGNHANTPDACCFNFFKRKIHPSKINSYSLTRADCTMPGVIFVTQKGLRLCVEPKLHWVKKTIQIIDDRNI